MQTLYCCKHYNYNDNLNFTCQKHKKRCILLEGNANCIDFVNGEILEIGEGKTEK